MFGEGQRVVHFNFRFFVSGTLNYFNCLDLVSNSNWQLPVCKILFFNHFFTYLNAESRINKDLMYYSFLFDNYLF